MGIFTVKTAYAAMLKWHDFPPLADIILGTLNKLWKNNVPSKVALFGWRLLLGRMPTR
ncbi:hypothetical protein A2U01_0113275, partial [Trifolium medium]|nr:hypothetical protein [Trifolium medium]